MLPLESASWPSSHSPPTPGSLSLHCSWSPPSDSPAAGLTGKFSPVDSSLWDAASPPPFAQDSREHCELCLVTRPGSQPSARSFPTSVIAMVTDAVPQALGCIAPDWTSSLGRPASHAGLPSIWGSAEDSPPCVDSTLGPAFPGVRTSRPGRQLCPKQADSCVRHFPSSPVHAV